MEQLETQVLIVGGGPVGLALAAELGSRGVATMLLEKRDGAVGTPKMNLVNVRTMEHCRRWGIAQAVRDAGLPADYPHDVVFTRTLAAPEIGRLSRPSKRAQHCGPNSPETYQQCSQLWFDPILRDFVSTLPEVQLRYRHVLVDFVEHADGVTARVRNERTGIDVVCRARYLVGCDGADSTVRDRLGIGQRGNGVLSRSLNGFFESDAFLRSHDKGPAVRYFFADSGGLWGNIVAIDGVKLWRFALTRVPEAEDLSTQELDARLQAAVGRKFHYRWVGVMPWLRRELVAERYGNDKVFLAGDAAHQLSPTGGFGMNTGIGDAVDLGWKLPAVLRGWGGARLLESYEAERKPIGERNLAQATGNFRLWVTPMGQLGDGLVDALRREFETEGVQLGYRYDGSPICVPDGTPNPPDDPMRYAPTSRPGSRAPHGWLDDGRSTLDLFGQGFVLLRFAHAIPVERLASAFAIRKVPLQVFDIPDVGIARLYEAPMALIRPDGHVAWRAGALPSDCMALVDTVRGA